MDDLWPVERLWRIMTAKVYARGQLEDVKELKRRIRKAWREIKKINIEEAGGRMKKIVEINREAD